VCGHESEGWGAQVEVGIVAEPLLEVADVFDGSSHGSERLGNVGVLLGGVAGWFAFHFFAFLRRALSAYRRAFLCVRNLRMSLGPPKTCQGLGSVHAQGTRRPVQS